MKKFKAALNAVRLQADEFPLLVPEHRVMRDKADASASRKLVPYTLRINARSQLTFVPMEPKPASARVPLAASADEPAEAAAAPPELLPLQLELQRLLQLQPKTKN